MNSNNSSSSGSTCSNTSFAGIDTNTASMADNSQMKLNEQNNFDAPSYTPSSINQPPQDIVNNNQQNQEIDTFMNNFMDTELNKSNVESQAEPHTDNTKMVGNLGNSYPTQDITDMQNPHSLNTNIGDGGIMPSTSEVTTSSNSGDNHNQLPISSSDNNQQLPINNNSGVTEQSQAFMTEKQMNDINKMADNMAAAEASEVQRQQQQEQQTQQKSKLAQLMQQPYMSTSSSSQLAVQQRRSLIQQSASGGAEQQQSRGGQVSMKDSQPLAYPSSSQPQNQQLAHPFTTNAAANNLPIQQQSMGQSVASQETQPISRVHAVL